jgi:hypothetical protein
MLKITDTTGNYPFSTMYTFQQRFEEKVELELERG